MVIWCTTVALKQTAAALLALLFLLIMGSNQDAPTAAKRHAQARPRVVPEHIITAARAEHPGDILRIELHEERELPVYHVELVDASGVVWSLHCDATTGTLLHARPDKQVR